MIGANSAFERSKNEALLKEADRFHAIDTAADAQQVLRVFSPLGEVPTQDGKAFAVSLHIEVFYPRIEVLIADALDESSP